MPSSSSLRWGVLGLGGIARTFTADLVRHGFRVTAAGSRSLDKARAFADEFGIPNAHGSYEELVADDEVDVVYVATPHSLHAENALLALDAGKHVLVEKAFTLNGDEAERVVAHAEEKGLVVLEAMWTRYLPHMRRIREILAAGTIGTVTAVLADHLQPLTDDPGHRLNDPGLGGGALLDLGIYPISFAVDVLGVPDAITAAARLTDRGVDAQVSAILGYANGAQATTASSMRGVGPNTASVVGTQGRIDIDRVWYSASDFRVIGRDGTVLESYVSEVDGRGMQYQALELERLVAAGELANDILPPRESVAIMRVLDEIRRQIGVAYPQER